MPYDRLCHNPVCHKPFRTYNPSVKCCSRICDILRRPSLATRFWAKVHRCEHGDFCPFCCWPWTASCNDAGYGNLGVKEGQKWITRLAHQIAWELVNQRSIPDGLQINHHCDNPPCCSPWHIYTGTHQQNALDAQRRGRLAIGEARSHLREAEVLMIRDAYRHGSSLPELVAMVHASQTTIWNILSGATWKHLPGALSFEERHTLVLSRRRIVNRTNKRILLTEDKVREIRVLRQQGVKRTVLAEQFGVNLSTIKAILQRRIWKDVA